MTKLGVLPTNGIIGFQRVSADGSMLWFHAGSTYYLWDQAHGIRSLQDTLATDPALGRQLAGWSLELGDNDPVSSDGRTLIGNGVDPGGHHAAWIIHLDALPDISLGSAQLATPKLVSFAYGVEGAVDHFTVGLYRSADGVTYDPADAIASKVIVPDLATPQAFGLLELDQPVTTTKSQPYIILVADPNNDILESTRSNNISEVEVPTADIAATPLTWDTTNGGVDYGYTISGGDLPQGATGALYWSTDIEFTEGKHSLIPNTSFTTVTKAQTAPYTGHVDAATLGTPPDPSYNYLLLVLNSDDAVKESDGPFAQDPNDVQSLSLHSPILILPGIAGTMPNSGSATQWFVDRGFNPEALQIDPLGHVYDDLIQTLENAG
jgi:hypothetical protein